MNKIYSFSIVHKNTSYNIIIDEEDANRVLEYNWNISFDKGKSIPRVRAKKHGKSIKLSEVILQKEKCSVSFIDGDWKNHSKQNLKVVGTKQNDYSEMEKCIELYTINNEVILIDKEDFKFVKDIPWSLDSNGYPHYRFGRMHRLIMSNYHDITGMIIDHKNHNVSDNRKSNLRICSKSQNACNSVLQKNSRTGFKGVNLSHNGSYMVRIKIGEIKERIEGIYDIEKAIKIRKSLEEELHGEFTLSNSLKEGKDKINDD